MGVGGNAGGDLGHRRVVASRGQSLERAHVEVRAELGRGGVDDREIGGDRDLLRQGDAQYGAENGVLVEPHGHLLPGIGGESREGEADVVGARWEEGEAVGARLVGHRGPGPLQGRAVGLDGDPGEDASLFVRYPSDDTARRLGRDRGPKGKKQHAQGQAPAAKLAHRDLLISESECNT